MAKRRRSTFFRATRGAAAPDPGGPSDVVWVVGSNASADGNDLTGTGESGTASSEQTLSAGQYVEFLVPSAEPDFILFGLHESVDFNAFNDYLLFQGASNATAVWIGDTYVTEVVHTTANATYRLALVDGDLVFSKDGTPFYTSAGYGSGPLYVIVRLENGDQILNAVIGDN